ncbi:MAG TPA: RNase adapter RapZ [Rhodanobacteraceae bacterium]
MTEPTPDTAPPGVHLLVLSGMSGGGKTVALRALEDLDFYCVDNLPVTLMPQLVKAIGNGTHQRIAVGVDVRNRIEDLSQIPYMLSTLASEGVRVHLAFIDSRDEVLIKRYSETRRRHPLSADGLSLADAIARERRLMRPLASIAENTIDTSDMNVHQLRRMIATRFAAATEGMTLLFESFAYKHGMPLDADFSFDARCLPNPHWDRALRPLSGKDEPVRDFLDAQAMVGEFLDDITRFLDTWLPRFESEDRNYVTICIGCTGGRHRSVYLVEKLAEHFRNGRHDVLTFHRELD